MTAIKFRWIHRPVWLSDNSPVGRRVSCLVRPPAAVLMLSRRAD